MYSIKLQCLLSKRLLGCAMGSQVKPLSLLCGKSKDMCVPSWSNSQYQRYKSKVRCPIGPTPRTPRDPPADFKPEKFNHDAFKLPAYIKANAYRVVKPTDILGPNAGKANAYKNPEYFSYHRFSYYDLKISANMIKDAAAKCGK